MIEFIDDDNPRFEFRTSFPIVYLDQGALEKIAESESLSAGFLDSISRNNGTVYFSLAKYHGDYRSRSSV
jgi:hypothetical protein